MVICPVCEHRQLQGDECDMCGKRLTGLPVQAEPVAVEAVPGLEATQLEGARAPVAPAAPLPDLDLTGQPRAPDLPAGGLPELERTAGAPVAAAPTAPVPDLEATHAPDDGVRTAAPEGAATCRYCRHVQLEGLVCDRCGMRLPRALRRAAAPVGEEGFTQCRRCHMRTPVNRACPECGTIARVSE